MACIKRASRSALVAFAPDSPYLAAGTMAGAVDSSFSSSANLEIFNLDFQSNDPDLPVIGDCPSSERFNRLSWSKAASAAAEEYSLGLVAGGLVDGSISVWNPLKLIRSNDTDGALVGRLLKHAGPVRGLEFNINSPNLLASGAEEGELCIWDLSNPTEPSHFPSLKGSGAQGVVSFLSWNHKVQHILASTTYNGTTMVWDLKRQKPVISLSDSKTKRWSVLQWNPDAPTQLIVASDDDSSPSLRLWDMRNTISPVKEFVGHTKGVIAMSWCCSDASFLLTCGKDDRTICWDTVTGEMVCELPSSRSWNFDIHWYPRIPGVISTSSFDGIGIYNIEGCSRGATEEGDFARDLSTTGSSVHLRAPKWLKRPTGASFGFGGRLVSFHPGSSSSATSPRISEVYVHNLVTELGLVSRSTEFEAAIQNGERASLRSLCDRKSHESKSEDDQETWGFLKVMFEDEGTARTKLLVHLGFKVHSAGNENVNQQLCQEITSTLSLDETTISKTELMEPSELNEYSTDNGEEFFNNLQTPKAEKSFSAFGDVSAVESGNMQNGEQAQEFKGLGEISDSSVDADIQSALIVGDYERAVLHCISANRMADALVIAHVGGKTLWESTRDQYLKKSHWSYLKVVSAIANNDLKGLVKTRPLNTWKETLALLCTFAEKEDWSVLCDMLATRLMVAGNTLAATLCYICAGNIDKTVEIWSRSLKPERGGRTYVDLLQGLMEKTIILALATGQKRFSASLIKLVENYAELLASQGLLTTAMEYLKLLESDGSSHELAILRNRIALAAEDREAPKALPLDNTQLQAKASYGADGSSFGIVHGSHHYSQAQLSQTVPSNLHAEAYHLHSNSSYAGGPGQYPPISQNQQFQEYATHGSFQQSQFSPMFIPSPVTQDTLTNFTPPSVTTQSKVRPFVPSTPALKILDQYEQATYPGISDRAHQAGQISDPAYQAGQHGPASLVTPPAPQPTVQTVDTSSVSAELRPVLTTLTRLYNETSEALGGSRANPAKKREIEDNSRKIGSLFAKLNGGDISTNAATKLRQLCQALDTGDFATALHIQVIMTTSDWDECNFWLGALKRMIKTREKIR